MRKLNGCNSHSRISYSVSDSKLGTRRVCTYASHSQLTTFTYATMSDVSMKPTEKKDEEKKDEKKAEEPKAEEPKKEPPTVQAEIKSNAVLIDRAVSTLEPRYTLRVLRTLTALRKRLNAKALFEAIEAIYPAST